MKDLPKYKTIIDDLILSILSNKLVVGDPLQSLIEVCKHYEVSRDTAVKAYQELKTRGIIGALPGKAYYVSSLDVSCYRKVFLLFDELSPYKSILYNSILENLDSSIGLDIYFHHFNSALFTKLISENAGNYTDYVIMPIVEAETELFERLQKSGRVYFLDQGLHYRNNDFPCVCQDFRNDLFIFLQQNSDRFRQFARLVMQIDRPKNESEISMIGEFEAGFERFCMQANIDYLITDKVTSIEKDTCYIIHSDLELVDLIKKCTGCGYEIGKDISIISFNDNPLKEVVSSGISTISTDFELMGRAIAAIVESNRQDRLTNSFVLKERRSFQLKQG